MAHANFVGQSISRTRAVVLETGARASGVWEFGEAGSEQLTRRLIRRQRPYSTVGHPFIDWSPPQVQTSSHKLRTSTNRAELSMR